MTFWVFSIFYQSYWSKIGPTLIQAIQNFFMICKFPPNFNHTNLVLIPKCQNPLEVGQFKLIIFCNYLYKIVSKVLVNYLKLFLNDLISKNQSAFILGWLI